MPTIKQLDWSKHQPDQTHTRKPAYNFKRFGKSASKGNKVKGKKTNKKRIKVKDKSIWQYREEKVTAKLMQLGKL